MIFVNAQIEMVYTLGLNMVGDIGMYATTAVRR